MKRIITVLTAVVFMILAAQICAGAETSAEISVSNASASPGSDVAVDVMISNNPGINTFALGFEYDDIRLELKEVTAAPELGGQFQYAKKAVWLNSSDTYYNGRILTLLFHVRDAASNGDAEIRVTFREGEISNYNEDDVPFRSVPGRITVTGSTRTSYGLSTTTQPSATAPTETAASSAVSTTTAAVTTTASSTSVTTTSTAANASEPTTTTSTTSYTRPETPDDPTGSITNVVRIAGTDRIGTALAISQRGWHSSETVIIANAYSYPDALAGAALSKKYDAPILLTDSGNVSNSVLQEIRRLGAKEVIILGGNSAVSKAAENELARTGAGITRIAGEDRSGTAARIAETLTDRASSVFLVSSDNFADALSVSSIAAIMGCPILYVYPDGRIPPETGSALQSLGCVSAYIIGGSAAVSTDAESNLRAIHVTAERIAGDDRYLTSLAVCENFSDITEEGSAALATGKNFPDALAGASFAAKKNIPVILVGDSVGSGFGEYAAKKKFGMVYAFGGKNAISDSVLYDISGMIGKTSETESFVDWLFSCIK